jgi:hypothetical protein
LSEPKNRTRHRREKKNLFKSNPDASTPPYLSMALFLINYSEEFVIEAFLSV